MKYNSTNPLPALLKYFRRKSMLTQQDVADSLSISRSGYANYEEGRTLPNIEQTIQLSKLFNHDLLYAYKLSLQYIHEHGYERYVPAEIVMESNTYLSSLESGSNTLNMLNNYKALNTNDQKLVNTFVENLAAKQSD